MQKISLQTWLERARQCRPGALAAAAHREANTRRSPPVASQLDWGRVDMAWRPPERNGIEWIANDLEDFIYLFPAINVWQTNRVFFLSVCLTARTCFVSSREEHSSKSVLRRKSSMLVCSLWTLEWPS
jgi:hypothetical protein